MGAAMIGTMYFLWVLWANCAQHGGKASGGGLISASLLKLQGSTLHYSQTALRSAPMIVPGLSSPQPLYSELFVY